MRIQKREATKDGELIYNIRMSVQLTQKQFAERIGTTQSTISNWETSRVEKVHRYWWKVIEEEFGDVYLWQKKRISKTE